MSIGIEVNMKLVRNHETLWKSNDTHFSLGTVLPSGYNTPRMKFSLENTKPGAVSTKKTQNQLICIQRYFHWKPLSKRNFPGIIINYLHVWGLCLLEE